jgi:hypothetical protein
VWKWCKVEEEEGEADIYNHFTIVDGNVTLNL